MDIEDHTDNLFLQRSINIVNSHNELVGPLYLHVSFEGLHGNFDEVTISDSERIPGLTMDENRLAKTAQIQDEAVKSLVDALQKNGLYDNSIIVLTGDNGGCLAEGHVSGLKGNKGSFFNGGIRVPALIHSTAYLLPSMANTT